MEASSEGTAVSTRIGSLITSTEWVTGDTAVSDVILLFESAPELDSLAVLVEDGIAFLSRSRFLSQLSRKFGYALYEKKPVRVLAESDPMLVHAEEDTVEVIQQATSRNAAKIYDDIIVIRENAYAGVVSMRSLMVHHKEVMMSSMMRASFLDDKTRKLEELSRVQAEFVATMTHELRAPLNAILGVASVISKDSRGWPELREGVQIISNRGQELLMIINNILDFHKLESGLMEPMVEEIRLESVIRDVVRPFQLMLSAGPVQIETEIHSAPLRFISDPVFLKRILTNLISNAVKFTENGSIKVMLESKSDWVLIQVEDSGVGIEASQMQRLFQKYTQLDTSSTRRYGGTGLGLAIVKMLVQQLGGEILVDSSPGKGTTVSLIFRQQKENWNESEKESGSD